MARYEDMAPGLTDESVVDIILSLMDEDPNIVDVEDAVPQVASLLGVPTEQIDRVAQEYGMYEDMDFGEYRDPWEDAEIAARQDARMPSSELVEALRRKLEMVLTEAGGDKADYLRTFFNSVDRPTYRVYVDWMKRQGADEFIASQPFFHKIRKAVGPASAKPAPKKPAAKPTPTKRDAAHVPIRQDQEHGPFVAGTPEAPEARAKGKEKDLRKELMDVAFNLKKDIRTEIVEKLGRYSLTVAPVHAYYIHPDDTRAQYPAEPEVGITMEMPRELRHPDEAPPGYKPEVDYYGMEDIIWKHVSKYKKLYPHIRFEMAGDMPGGAVQPTRV